jgi:hypothetical protein
VVEKVLSLPKKVRITCRSPAERGAGAPPEKGCRPPCIKGFRGFPLHYTIFFWEKFVYIKKKHYFCKQNKGNRFQSNPYFAKI